MSKPVPDDLLLDFTRGFAFDESLQQQLNYEQMLALAGMLLGWTLTESIAPKRSAWLTGMSEGLLAEADHLGPDWSPPEPEELSPFGIIGRIANGDPIRPEQTPRGRWDLGLPSRYACAASQGRD